MRLIAGETEVEIDGWEIMDQMRGLLIHHGVRKNLSKYEEVLIKMIAVINAMQDEEDAECPGE